MYEEAELTQVLKPLGGGGLGSRVCEIGGLEG